MKLNIMNQRILASISMPFGIAIASYWVMVTQPAAFANLPAQQQAKQRPPAPPMTPPPNRTRSGGSLGEAATCMTGSQSLRALVPVENPVLTTADHPTFLFYVPFGADQVQYGEFSILVGPTEMTRLHQTRFTLTQPGVVSITLPPHPDYRLKENTPYHWYFKLYCHENSPDSPGLTSPTPADLQVDGWVQRVALTPDRQQQIQTASPEVWYDSAAQVANRLSATPADTTLQQQWRNLLQHIGSADLVQEPIVGSVQMIEEQP
jgi:hypothetical protein